MQEKMSKNAKLYVRSSWRSGADAGEEDDCDIEEDFDGDLTVRRQALDVFGQQR